MWLLPLVAGIGGTLLTGGSAYGIRAAYRGYKAIKTLKSLKASYGELKKTPPDDPVHNAPLVVPVMVPGEERIQVETENRYVTVNKDSFKEATSYAHAEVVKRYPAALGTVEFIESVVKQVLGSEKP